MIDEQRTLEIYGYTSDELKPQSSKPIVTVCNECGKYRVIPKQGYRMLCLSCSKSKKRKPLSEETKQKIAKANTGKKRTEKTRHKISVVTCGKNHPNYKKHPSKETRKKLSEAKKGGNHPMYGKTHTEDAKSKISMSTSGKNNPNYGKSHSEDTKHKISATLQGIPLSEWQGYVTENPYCEKFNESCRERNREKYGGVCFICGKTKEQNSNKRLSVHHISKNKMEGCDGSKWQLIPLCVSCHSKAHHEPLQSRINYLLNL